VGEWRLPSPEDGIWREAWVAGIRFRNLLLVVRLDIYAEKRYSSIGMKKKCKKRNVPDPQIIRTSDYFPSPSLVPPRTRFTVCWMTTAVTKGIGANLKLVIVVPVSAFLLRDKSLTDTVCVLPRQCAGIGDVRMVFFLSPRILVDESLARPSGFPV